MRFFCRKSSATFLYACYYTASGGFSCPFPGVWSGILLIKKSMSDTELRNHLSDSQKWQELIEMADKLSELFKEPLSGSPTVYLSSENVEKIRELADNSDFLRVEVSQIEGTSFLNGFRIKETPGLGSIGVIAPEELSYRGYTPPWLSEPVIQVPCDARIEYHHGFGWPDAAAAWTVNERGSGKARAFDYSRKNKLPRKKKKAFIKAFGREAYHMGFYC